MAKKHTFLTTKLIFILFIFLVFTLTIFVSLLSLNKIYPNIYISSLYISDKTKDEAEEYIKNNFKVNEKIQLSINGKQSFISTSEILESVEYKESITRAYNYTHSGNLFLDFFIKIKLLFKPVNLATVIKVNEDKLLETLLIISNSNELKPVLPSASSIKGEIVINKGKDGVDINFDKARFDIGNSISFRKNETIIVELEKINYSITELEAIAFKSKAEKLISKKLSLKSDENEIIIDGDKLLTFISPKDFYEDNIQKEANKIATDLNRNPQDSIFIIENQKVKEFAPSKSGIVVDEKKLINLIKEDLNNLLISDSIEYSDEIPVIKTTPKINNEDVNDLGIKTLIGTGFSNFKGSIPNRIHNVNLAQSKFKGVLVAPDEVVSFNDVLGDVSSFTGYKAAYVIKDGKTVLGDGGGVCQVSTTLFRAVLNAGLPIVERRAHAYRVGYYEQGFGPGLDATVYSPTTDFKFKNDTPEHLLLQPTVDLKNLTLRFDIYGTDDGRVSKISKPIITSSAAPADDLYVDDPTLPIGQTKQIEHRAYGAKVVFDYNVTRNGEELINQKFVSNYRPWQAVYLRGTMQ